MNMKILLSSIIGGVIMALVTGLIPNIPPTPPPPGLGRMYGYPIVWIYTLVLGPEHFPWRVNALNLVADIVIWTVIIGIVMFVLSRISHR